MYAIRSYYAQGPPEDVVGASAEEIRPRVEEIGTHADVLAPLPGDVITSYSIHYTKLYELSRTDRLGARLNSWWMIEMP